MKTISPPRQPSGRWVKGRAGELALALLLAGMVPLPSLAQQSAMVGQSPEAIYNSTCAYCHSRSLPPFPAVELLGRQLDPQTIQYIASHGQGAMPAFRFSELSQADLERLGKWIEASPAPPKPTFPPPAPGAKP